MNKLLTTEIVEVANGVLLTIEKHTAPSAGDPLAERGGYKIGPTYYPSLEGAVCAIPDVVLARAAVKALKA